MTHVGFSALLYSHHQWRTSKRATLHANFNQGPVNVFNGSDCGTVTFIRNTIRKSWEWICRVVLLLVLNSLSYTSCTTMHHGNDVTTYCRQAHCNCIWTVDSMRPTVHNFPSLPLYISCGWCRTLHCGVRSSGTNGSMFGLRKRRYGEGGKLAAGCCLFTVE